MTMRLMLIADDEFEFLHDTIPAQMGRVNLGFYCGVCRNFTAMAIALEPPPCFEITSNGLPMVQCRHCNTKQRMAPSEFVEILLTDANAQQAKPARPAH